MIIFVFGASYGVNVSISEEVVVKYKYQIVKELYIQHGNSFVAADSVCCSYLGQFIFFK